MSRVPPEVREQVLEEWNHGNATEWQLAERFSLARDPVGEIHGAPDARRRPIRRSVLAMARELYNVMPIEIAYASAGRIEKLVGIRSGLLAVPSL